MHLHQGTYNPSQQHEKFSFANSSFLDLIYFLKQDMQLGKSCTAQRCWSCRISPQLLLAFCLGNNSEESLKSTCFESLGIVDTRIGNVKCGSLPRLCYISPRLSDIWLSKMNHYQPFKRLRTKNVSRMV